MNILEIYKKYQIMPQLAEHQLRVAGVASIILENLTLTPPSAKASAGRPALSQTPTVPSGQRERGDVALACLLHDMGNIVKFDFAYTAKFMSELIEASTLSYWQKVQREFRAKFGKDSHEATMNIIAEIGASGRVRELVDCIGFDKGLANVETEDFSKKICAYSDVRVEPYGVVPLEERFLGLRKRYHINIAGSEEVRSSFENALREIEKQIFAHSKIKPEDITDESIKEKIEILRNLDIYPALISSK